MAQTNTIITARGLIKKFGALKALDGLNLDVQKGEVHGFLGPNGSGKSTTIRILLGLLRKTGGTVSLLGQDPWQHAVELHRHLTYVPGDVSLWPGLSGGEVIDLFGSLRGGINKKLKQQLLRDFQLDPKKKCRTYSKGNRQKVALVAALAADAEIYILDEPTSGLDPLMESVFKSYIKDLKKSHKTILLSSHILAEVEELADRVTIIREGQTVESGTLSELRHLSHNTIHVTTKKPAVGLKKMRGVHDLILDKNTAVFDADQDNIGAILAYLAPLGITHMTSEPPKLEDLFMRHYDKQKTDS